MEILNEAKIAYSIAYRFLQYCLHSNINTAQANFKIGIEYLIQYLYTGVDYSSIGKIR